MTNVVTSICHRHQWQKQTGSAVVEVVAVSEGDFSGSGQPAKLYLRRRQNTQGLSSLQHGRLIAAEDTVDAFAGSLRFSALSLSSGDP
jgi:hypothetical protein